MDKTCTGTEQRSAVAVDAEPILSWRVHLLMEKPVRMFLVASVLLISLYGCYVIFHSLFSIAVVLLLFAASLSDYLFPVRYEITEKGASSRTIFGKNTIEWDRVKKYYVDNCGIKLSSLPKPSRLEAYRGVYLRFGAHREEVVDAVRRMRDVRSTTSGSVGRGSES
ncbi:MAG: hypothetical protein ACYC27_13610 [Armatimonadota bacterium]